MVQIAVIGAGIVGLTSAVNVQKLLPSANVTIISDQFGVDTTSAGAGGLFRPTTQLIVGVSQATIKEWIKESWGYYTSLAMSPHAKETGQALVPGYTLSNDEDYIKNPVYKDIVFNFRELKPEELKRLNFPFKYGNFFTSVITQPKKFLPWLMRQFKEKGGKVEFGKVAKLEELAGKYDIVINCTALGAQQLVNDQNVYPVKGQLVHVKAPWIKMFVYCQPIETYFIPHDDYVIIGGTRGKDDYSTEVSALVQENILKKAGELLPQIKNAPVVGSWAGLRPSRDPLRLEKELLEVNGKIIRVVHNYGHGANGFSLSWGTSLWASRMAKEWADEIPPSSKL